MTREIKFRFFHRITKTFFWYDLRKGNKAMLGGGWLTGFSMDIPESSDPSVDDGILLDPASIEIMQYTGLKDKNGKEIYEGDIVQNVSSDGKRLSKFKIIWSESRCRFMKEREDYNFYDLETGQNFLEIIGNVYENPELLTK